MRQITAPELAALLAAGESVDILDVREHWEHQLSRLDDCIHIPMAEITTRFDELRRDRPIVCLCHHGVRSMQVALFLARQGFDQLYNLHGGIDAWSNQVDPSCPTY